MCGIVGYIGPKNAIDIIMEGLRRLEYRGYDSAGICIHRPSSALEIFKAAGKLQNLEELLNGKELYSNTGIGHTRWATHGKVVQENAHPHGNDNIAVVHNGIIENSLELKEMLYREGFSFISETDSEVFFVLVIRFIKMGQSLRDAVSQSFQLIRGNSAFVVMDREGKEIVTVKRGAPIVCGINEVSMEAFVSSDPYALIGYADKIYFPEDEVICVLDQSSENRIQAYELSGKKSKRITVKPQIKNFVATGKGEFEHFMLKEIYEQPRLIRELLSYYLDGEGQKSLEEAGKFRPKRIHISACGTAWHAGLVVREFFEKQNKIPTDVELASEFRYRDPLIYKDDLAVFISQSGETADTLAAQELCHKRDLTTIGIVNVEGSTLYRNCTKNLLIQAGIEVGVASTKAFTLQVVTGYLLSMAMAEKVHLFSVRNELTILADRIDEVLAQVEDIQNIAKQIYSLKGFLFTGRGKYYPISLEGALKLKEIAYVHAEGYAAGELKHGPIALIDEKMVNVAIFGPELLEKCISNVEEVKARGGIIVGMGPQNISYISELCEYFIPLNFEGLSELAPLYVNVVSQLLSYFMAKLKGTDIDKPRNLAKSVTVE